MKKTIVLYCCLGLLLANAGTFWQTAQAQTACGPNLTIGSVTYLGKANGKDRVRVIFSAVTGTGQFCQRFGVIPNNTGNVPVRGFDVTVKITRKHGHQDTGAARGVGSFFGGQTVEVEIPRANLETDPQSYEVTVKTNFGGILVTSATANGNGAPALAAATITNLQKDLGVAPHNLAGGPLNAGLAAGAPGGNFGQVAPDTVPLNCFFGLTLNNLSFTPGNGTTQDAVTVGWTLTPPAISCLNAAKPVSVTAKVVRANNNVGNATASVNGGNSITLSLNGMSAPPVNFSVAVVVSNGSVTDLQASKTGNF